MQPERRRAAKKAARGFAERELVAQINVVRLRSLELAWLRGLALASIPAWLEVRWRVLPGFLAWLAFLGQGLCLGMAATFGVLERRWAHRAMHLERGGPGVSIESTWTPWDELRAALWCGLAVVSLVPWAYEGLGRALPPPLLSAVGATGWAVLLLLAAAESLAARRARA